MADDVMDCIFGEERQCTAVIVVRMIMASISLIGCVFMMLVIWLLSKYKIFAQRMILHLTIAAFLNSIGLLMVPARHGTPVCRLEGFLLTFSDWAVLLWVLIIAINVYLIAVREVDTEKYEIIYVCTAWIFPLFIACLPFIGSQYGSAGIWCWIKETSHVWRFVIWYIPLYVGIAVMFILYVIIVYKVKGQLPGTYNPDKERRHEMMRKYAKLLRVYPVVYLAIIIFPTINRLENAISTNEEPVFILTLLHAATSALQGSVNAVVYGLDPETRKRLTRTQIKAALIRKKSETVIQEYIPDRASSTGVDDTAVVTFPQSLNEGPGHPPSQAGNHNIYIVSEHCEATRNGQIRRNSIDASTRF